MSSALVVMRSTKRLLKLALGGGMDARWYEAKEALRTCREKD